tara:strand:+ start:9945 stop:10457 length:513 start_codon:yes stop_codon:yes gene_type:complete
MKKVLIAVVLSSLLGACASNDNEFLIDGKTYLADENGTIQLTQKEFKSATDKGEVKLLDEDTPDVKVSKEELDVALTDEEAFFSLIGQANPDDHVAMLVKPGSLKANLDRIVSENNWNALYFDGPDMFISSPRILHSANVPMGTMDLIGDYDMYPCIDEEEKTITVIKDE